jgi:hypothetical protein
MEMISTQVKGYLKQITSILRVQYQCSIKKMKCKEKEWLKDKKNYIKIE